MKRIEDYLHLYLGCRFIYNNGTAIRDGWDGFEKTNTWYYDDEERKHIKLGGHIFQISKIKLILRHISNISEEEKMNLGWKNASPLIYEWIKNDQMGIKPSEFHYLLSKHFDLFGLIESGLAIDKTKIENHEYKI